MNSQEIMDKYFIFVNGDPMYYTIEGKPWIKMNPGAMRDIAEKIKEILENEN